MDNDISLLGIAKKAGLLLIGVESIGAASRSKKARAILSASDASDGSKRRARGYAETYGIPHLLLPRTKAELGVITGREQLGMLALTDAGIAAKLASRLAARDPETYGEAAAALEQKAARLLRRKREAAAHKRNIRTGKRRTTQ
ncbi:MAG: 50S ribosomal protein L7 [Oscillospiraceae bacterium]|jgi:ribosomal protein L7Ae-like RNA K-turn-binding protein|nr:50S ribosomal protein L7 [Oscillospiraceae bacterium]